MNKQKLKTSRILSNNALMLRYIGKYCPSVIFMKVLLMVIDGLCSVLNTVYIAKVVLDAVQKNKSFGQMLPFLCGAIILNIIKILIQSYYDGSFFPRKKEILYKSMHSELFLKAKDMELACYDNPKFYNDFVWAMQEADQKALAVLDSLGNLIKHLTAITSISAIIISVDAWGIVVAIVLVLFAMISRLKLNKLEYELELVQKPIQRKRDYTSRVLYQPDYAKEVRLNQVKEKLIENFHLTNVELIKTIRKFSLKMVKWDFMMYTLVNTVMIDIIYLGYLLYQTIVYHAFTYGEFYALYTGTDRLKRNLSGIVYDITEFHRHSLFIEKFRTFLDYESKLEEPENPKPIPKDSVALKLDHVSFTYDSLEEPTIRDISLSIKPGEKVALVGYNGAGKSTLIKLLMRLYDPTEGSIGLGENDIREYKIHDYHNYFGAVFQDYQTFAGTVGENVMMDCVKNTDEPTIAAALEQSGFTEKLVHLKNGTKTVLTREFDKEGVNLSGGEAQKVAIARTFPRDCKIVILDEPSSALDPISEYNVNQSMLEAAKDKTVIFISHRLSTTRIADRIIMLDHGKIIEQGSHDELMELNGQYAKMFLMQAEKYRQEQAG